MWCWWACNGYRSTAGTLPGTWYSHGTLGGPMNFYGSLPLLCVLGPSLLAGEIQEVCNLCGETICIKLTDKCMTDKKLQFPGFWILQIFVLPLIFLQLHAAMPPGIPEILKVACWSFTRTIVRNSSTWHQSWYVLTSERKSRHAEQNSTWTEISSCCCCEIFFVTVCVTSCVYFCYICKEESSPAITTLSRAYLFGDPKQLRQLILSTTKKSRQTLVHTDLQNS